MTKYRLLSDEELKSCNKNNVPEGQGVPTQFTAQRRIFKLAAKLVDFGFIVEKFDDEELVDFTIRNLDNDRRYKIQLTSRITTREKYENSSSPIYIAFPLDESVPMSEWVIVPHNELNKIFSFENAKKYNHRIKVPNKIREDVIKLSILDELINI